MKDRYDVIVIGGGPGGSTCATMLTRAGYDVLLLERDTFPRFHIGESLTAFAADAFKTLGVYEELKSINYVRKKGIEFVLPDKRKKVYFPEQLRNEPNEIPWSFQMPRSTLDTVLLRNAERNGVTVREQHPVTQVLFEGSKAVGVEYRDHSEESTRDAKKAFARWIVDASGQNGAINRQLKNNCINDPLLDDKIAVFSHWAGDINIVNSDEHMNFKLCVHPNRTDWAWFLPVGKDLVSIGIVIDRRSVKERGKSLQELFEEHAAQIPDIAEFMQNPTLEQVEKMRGVKDFSYRARQYYGDGWALTGDSAGFIDPIFSTGLQITFNSAFKLADALDKVMQHPEKGDLLLTDYAEDLNRFFRINAMLVYRFYECGIDPDKAASPMTRIEWAGAKHMWRCGVAVSKLIPHRRNKLEVWAREVLFGNIQPGNKIADLFLVMAENYEELLAKKKKQGSPRLQFNDLRT